MLDFSVTLELMTFVAGCAICFVWLAFVIGIGFSKRAARPVLALAVFFGIIGLLLGIAGGAVSALLYLNYITVSGEIVVAFGVTVPEIARYVALFTKFMVWDFLCAIALLSAILLIVCGVKGKAKKNPAVQKNENAEMPEKPQEKVDSAPPAEKVKKESGDINDIKNLMDKISGLVNRTNAVPKSSPEPTETKAAVEEESIENEPVSAEPSETAVEEEENDERDVELFESGTSEKIDPNNYFDDSYLSETFEDSEEETDEIEETDEYADELSEEEISENAEENYEEESYEEDSPEEPLDEEIIEESTDSAAEESENNGLDELAEETTEERIDESEEERADLEDEVARRREYGAEERTERKEEREKSSSSFAAFETNRESERTAFATRKVTPIDTSSYLGIRPTSRVLVRTGGGVRAAAGESLARKAFAQKTAEPQKPAEQKPARQSKTEKPKKQYGGAAKNGGASVANGRREPIVVTGETVEAEPPKKERLTESATIPPRMGQATTPVKDVEPISGGLPVTKKYVLVNRRSVVNMFGDYLRSKNEDERKRLENSLNTIIFK